MTMTWVSILLHSNFYRQCYYCLININPIYVGATRLPSCPTRSGGDLVRSLAVKFRHQIINTIRSGQTLQVNIV